MRKNGKRILALCVALAVVIGTLWGTGVLPKYGIFMDNGRGDAKVTADEGDPVFTEFEMGNRAADSDRNDPSEEELAMLNQEVEGNIVEETVDESAMQTTSTLTNDGEDTTIEEDEAKDGGEDRTPDSEENPSVDEGGQTSTRIV